MSAGHDVQRIEGLKRSAYNALREENYPLSLAYFLMHFKLSRAGWNETKADFFMVLDAVHEYFETDNDWENQLRSFEEVMKIIPRSSEIHVRLGSCLFRRNHLIEAAVYFKEALTFDRQCAAARESLETVCNMLVERWHFRMLNDVNRNNAYKDAITKCIRNKRIKSVLDIGSGTGILSMLAVDAGASEVYACESSRVMCDVSAHVLIANQKRDVIKVINKHSTDLEIGDDVPSKVDLIVTETLDCGLLGEHIVNTLLHACKNLANEPFQVIPAGATVWGCLIQSKELRKRQRVLTDKIGRLDIKNVRIISHRNEDDPYSAEKLNVLRGSYDPLCKPFKIIDIQFNDHDCLQRLTSGIRVNSEVRCNSPGQVDAVVLWFDLFVDEDSVISSRPTDESCWEQAIFPVVHLHKDATDYFTVEDGCEVDVTFKCQNHFTLDDIKIRSKCDDKNSRQPNEIIELSDIITSQLNSSLWYKKLDEALEIVRCGRRRQNVIDISNFAVGALISLKMGADSAAVINSPYDKQLLKLGEINGVDVSKIIFYEDYDKLGDSGQRWDIMIIEPVSEYGVLKDGILEDIALMKASCLVPTGIVIPEQIAVYTSLIDSESLIQQSRVTGDSNTLNYKIADHINHFQSITHMDFDLRTLRHHNLARPIPIFILNLNQKVKHFGGACADVSSVPHLISESAVMDFNIMKDGNVTAMPYWFMFKMFTVNAEKKSNNTRQRIEMLYESASQRGQHSSNGNNSHGAHGSVGHSSGSGPMPEFQRQVRPRYRKILKRSNTEFSVHYNMFESDKHPHSNVVSTLDMNSHWRQSAILLESPLRVKNGDSVIVSGICDKSCIRIICFLDEDSSTE